MSYQKPELLDPAPTGDTVKEAILKTDTNVDDIYWSLNDILSKIPGAQQPQELLDAIKTVDGSGSGLDADYLDGLDSTDFERYLGTPLSDGYILSSTISGARSWIPAPSGGGGDLPTWEEILAIVTPHMGSGSTIDSDMVDGIHASGFSLAGHTHNDATPTTPGFFSAADKSKLDDMSDPALKEEFRAFSAGTPDAGMPIKLDGYGVLDVSFLSIKIFNLEGDWTPTAGNEYPAPADPGDYWIIENVGDIVSGGYTFTGGFLSGKTIYDNELLVKGRDDKWGIIHMKVDPNLYYRLDGTNHLTADFQAGGFRLRGVANGETPGDAVTMFQLSTKLDLTGGTMTGLLSLSFGNAGLKFFNDRIDLNPEGVEYLLSGYHGGFQISCDDASGYISAPFKMEVNRANPGNRLQLPLGGEWSINNDRIYTDAYHPGVGGDAVWGSITGDITSQADLMGHLDGKLFVDAKAADSELLDGLEATEFERALGNPSTTGYVLSSDTAGNRSWIEMTGGGTPAPVDSVNGKTGVVVLDAADVGAAPASHGHTEYLEKAGDTMTGFLNTNGHSDNATVLSGGSGSKTIDLSLGNFFSHDNGGGSATYSMSVPSGNAGGFCFVIYLSGSGAKSFSNTSWVNGKAPDNSNGVAVLFNTAGGAGNWIGAWGPM